MIDNVDIINTIKQLGIKDIFITNNQIRYHTTYNSTVWNGFGQAYVYTRQETKNTYSTRNPNLYSFSYSNIESVKNLPS